MILKSREQIIGLLKNLHERTSDNKLNTIWTGFHSSAIALYNEKEVFLAGHPAPPTGFNFEEGIYTGAWNNNFVGNSAIVLNGIPTAIWDIKYLHPFIENERIYSVIVHELFHAYQFVNFKGLEKRFPNDIDFIKYPITAENLALRKEERRNILLAVFEKDFSLRGKYISKFISNREKRKSIIGDNIDLELRIESLEGTASYVEYKAYAGEGCLPEEYILSRFGESLEGYPENLANFRSSCYSSGMFICMLLDEISPGWKKEYNESFLYLYDFFKEKYNVPTEDTKVRDAALAKYLVELENLRRQREFDEFNKSPGHRITIKGSVDLRGYDPMNIIPANGSALHKTFLRFGKGDNNIFIPGNVLSCHSSENLMQLEEVQCFSPSAPLQKGSSVIVEGIGEIAGKLTKKDGIYFIDIDI